MAGAADEDQVRQSFLCQVGSNPRHPRRHVHGLTGPSSPVTELKHLQTSQWRQEGQKNRPIQDFIARLHQYLWATVRARFATVDSSSSDWESSLYRCTWGRGRGGNPDGPHLGSFATRTHFLLHITQ